MVQARAATWAKKLVCISLSIRLQYVGHALFVPFSICAGMHFQIKNSQASCRAWHAAAARYAFLGKPSCETEGCPLSLFKSLAANAGSFIIGNHPKRSARLTVPAPIKPTTCASAWLTADDASPPIASEVRVVQA
ncbi:uncharacterized protein ALTATR162_LOCUS3166 [Alternaria atra]|uniref:Uncharacterized protein n=1 Tax=Alternaria atra TaxID=119953 RepID=A0A8J2MZT3_9PLEO|nr:uncharacterized protein ALTATR162_LOCUS3166 [Alternaria atra]CAG5153415.1 unnamed protein product [Alternaria atra]